VVVMSIPPETFFLPAIVFVILYVARRVPEPSNLSPSAVILVVLVLAVLVTNIRNQRQLLKTCGYYCVLDGFISILMYINKGQTISEHIPRVLRTLIGVVILMIRSQI